MRSILEGKRVVLIDDSIVRGTTSRKIVGMVRAAGAREVHMRISSPPTTGPCYYGIDTPRKSELIASPPVGRGDPAVHRRRQPGLPVARGPADRGRRPGGPAALHGLLLGPVPGGRLPGRGLAAPALRQGPGLAAPCASVSRSAAVLFVALAVPLRAAEPPSAIPWTDWSDAAFERARADNRLVLLDLGAVWCHWCHVMEETTYKDPEVVSLIQTRFVAVHVDQDARPDLSNRYEDYGWPATVVFDSAGQELVKFQGYIEPERMRGLLRAVIADPTPGPSVADAAGPSVGRGRRPHRRRAPRSPGHPREPLRHASAAAGGPRTSTWTGTASSAASCARARAIASAERMARETLDRQLKLVDPVWGGVYQYSDSGDWDHPHFEKIMSMQAEDLRIYALAYAQFGDARYLQAARDVHKFLTTFLRGPDGAFYVSQDADVVQGEHSGAYFALGDAERRARGVPRVDTHLYTRETAWAATALLALHAATGEEAFSRDAAQVRRVDPRRTARSRAAASGTTPWTWPAPTWATPWPPRACSSRLYAATGERPWLERAEKTLAFVGRALPARRRGRPRHRGRGRTLTTARRPSATRTSWPRASRTWPSTSPGTPPTAPSRTKRCAISRVPKWRAGSTPAASSWRTGSARAIPST